MGVECRHSVYRGENLLFICYKNTIHKNKISLKYKIRFNNKIFDVKPLFTISFYAFVKSVKLWPFGLYSLSKIG